MKLKDNIALSETGFLFDPNSGESFSVNASGKEVIKLIADGKDLESIAKEIIGKYDIDTSTFNRYMDDFAHSLRRFNLLEPDDHDEK